MKTYRRSLVKYLAMPTAFLVVSICFAVFGSTVLGCDVTAEQLSRLSSEEKANLVSYGFAYALSLPEDLPPVVISETIISECSNRYIASKYFSNKIEGRERFRITEVELLRARHDLAKAACKAIDATGAWPDGVAHEIYNVVSDDLFPFWEECQIHEVLESKNFLNIYHFTPKSFAYPRKGVFDAVEKRLNEGSGTVLGVALLLFLKKNYENMINIEIAEKRLTNASPIRDGFIPNDEIIKRSLELLSGQGAVSFHAARDLVVDVYGL